MFEYLRTKEIEHLRQGCVCSRRSRRVRRRRHLRWGIRAGPGEVVGEDLGPGQGVAEALSSSRCRHRRLLRPSGAGVPAGRL